MTPVNELVSRFVEAPTDFSEEDLDALIAALRENPALAVELREQLMLDDLLAQKLAVDRRFFLAQVEQRIADYERSQQEIDSHVADLHAIAATEIERPQRHHGAAWWMNILLVTAAAALIAGVFLVPGYFQPGRALARVESVSGEVQTVAGQGVRPLAAGEVVRAKQQITLGERSSVVLVYSDKTRVELSDRARVTLGSDTRTGAKLVNIAHGEVAADVAKQTAGPMQFTTPHAVATVLGTELRLTVGDDVTRLDVTEGQVRFAPRNERDSMIVGAHQSGEVRNEQLLELRELTWPDDRDATVFLFEGTDKLTLARNPDTGNMRDTPLEPLGSVRLGDDRALHMTGGVFATADGGHDVARILRDGDQFTLEAIVLPQRDLAKGTIVAMAFAGGRGSFELAQERDRLVFRLETDQTNDGPETLHLGKLTGDQPTHVTVAYRDGRLLGYFDGREVARREDVHGALRGWGDGPIVVGGDSSNMRTWRGSVAGLAIHKRALDEVEIARNARNFRLLHAVSAALPEWRSLMRGTDPIDRTRAGEWRTFDDAWQSEGTGERLALDPARSEYDFRLELHLLQSSGEPIELLLPVQHRHVAAVLQTVGGTSRQNGLELIDVVRVSDNHSGLNNRQLELHRIYNIEGRVRVRGDQATVVVTVDREPWIEWTGERESLSLRTERQDWSDPAPILHVGNNRVQIHSLHQRVYTK